MNRLILIRGPICAGKSTMVNLLQDTLEACSVVDQDVLKRAIDKKRRSDWRDNIAFDTTLYLSDLLMKEGRDIIADIHSSLPKKYEEYQKLAMKNGYQLFSFLLYPPLEVCLQRNKSRIIPDIDYEITDDDIKKYWENPCEVKGETVFDTSVVTTEDVVAKILETIR